MEREGAEDPALGPKLEARASAYGPEDPMLPGVPEGTPGSEPEKDSRLGADIQTRPMSFRAKPRNLPSPSMGEGQGEGDRSGQGAGQS